MMFMTTQMAMTVLYVQKVVLFNEHYFDIVTEVAQLQ